MPRCHYEVLGLQKGASASDIQKAYKKLALEWHPDKNGDRVQEAERMFKQINEAYEVLADPVKKANYDLFTPHGPNLFQLTEIHLPPEFWKYLCFALFAVCNWLVLGYILNTIWDIFTTVLGACFFCMCVLGACFFGFLIYKVFGFLLYKVFGQGAADTRTYAKGLILFLVVWTWNLIIAVGIYTLILMRVECESKDKNGVLQWFPGSDLYKIRLMCQDSTAWWEGYYTKYCQCFSTLKSIISLSIPCFCITAAVRKSKPLEDFVSLWFVHDKSTVEGSKKSTSAKQRQPRKSPSQSASLQMGAVSTRSRSTRNVDNGEDLGEGLCVVCMERPATHALLPCGHRCACEEDAMQLRDCPICRAGVQSRSRIYD